ncbi:FeoA family protein [Oscillospiraceae bacterium MB08-C2-2]|nr:FeoA family protein [Oscillospiraceae bacterium MB08-C2-2]
MPLMSAELGKEVTIQRCQMNGELKRHVDNLGLIPGEKVTPIACNNGNLIIKVKNSRLAINMGVASKIFVS